VVIQPAISATTDSGPAAATASSSQRGRPLRRQRRNSQITPISARNEPMPTIVWKE
jgi:hypothetical protein